MICRLRQPHGFFMKRYLHTKLIYFLFLFCFSFSQNYYSISNINKPITFYPRFNIDGLGTFKLHFLLENSDNDLVKELEYRNRGSKNLGYTIGADIIFQKTKWINFGGGFEIQFERQLSDSPGAFGFNSYYGIIQVNSSSGLIYFARYGDTNFHGDSDFTSGGIFVLAGSAYASVGTLIRFSDNIFVEISRSYIQGDINFFGDDVDEDRSFNDLMSYEYETYNIGVGYYFE